MDNSLSKIKQPKPSVDSSQNIQYKLIQGAPVGIVSAPKISKTPLRDWVEIKRQENPHTIYKIYNKDNNLKSIHTTATIGVILCGIASLVNLIKHK